MQQATVEESGTASFRLGMEPKPSLDFLLNQDLFKKFPFTYFKDMLVNFSYLCQSAPNVLLLHSVKCLIVIQDHFNFNPCNRAIELNQCMTHVTRCPFSRLLFVHVPLCSLCIWCHLKVCVQCIKRTEGLRKTDCMYGCSSSHIMEWV